MKKIGFICMMVLLAAVGMSSCAESSEKKVKNVANKIEANEELTAEDYTCMIDYVGDYAEKAQKYVDMMINGTDNAEATAGMNQLKDEYPYLDTFRNCIRVTPMSKFSSENLEQIGKYAGYIEFSAPAGYTLTTDPAAAGMEVAAPSVDNGVVAGAVDTIEIKR